MRTLYIDVYFLINFTVDVLALYFSARLSKIHTTVLRLIIAGSVGAIYAVIGILLIDSRWLMIPLSIFILIFVVVIVAKGVGIYRRLRYAVSFLIFELIIGGLVYCSYCMLSEFVELGQVDAGSENRNLLILSLIVLLSIGVLKIIISFFGNVKSERSVRLEIEVINNRIEIEAFVDSGNLAVDPFDKTPVMLVAHGMEKKILGFEINDPLKLDVGVRKRIRVIPVSFGGTNKILFGIKPDKVYVVRDGYKERIDLVLAFDNNDNEYGGFSALIPLSSLEDVIT